MNQSLEMNKNSVLVVGAGISGITASVEIAEVGYNVILIEKLPYLASSNACSR